MISSQAPCFVLYREWGPLTGLPGQNSLTIGGTGLKSASALLNNLLCRLFNNLSYLTEPRAPGLVAANGARPKRLGQRAQVTDNRHSKLWECSSVRLLRQNEENLEESVVYQGILVSSRAQCRWISTKCAAKVQKTGRIHLLLVLFSLREGSNIRRAQNINKFRG